MAKLTRPLGETHDAWVPVHVNGETFEVLITHPNGEDCLQDEALIAEGWYRPGAQSNAVKHRIETTIAGWRGLQDADGGDIEFSWDNLMALCTSYPGVFSQISLLANRAYKGDEFAEPKPKNSE